jgi:hypothetical protein
MNLGDFMKKEDKNRFEALKDSAEESDNNEEHSLEEPQSSVSRDVSLGRCSKSKFKHRPDFSVVHNPIHNSYNHNSYKCTASRCCDEEFKDVIKEFKGALNCDHRCHVCDATWTGQMGATTCPNCRCDGATSTSPVDGLTTFGCTAHGVPAGVADAQPAGSPKRSTTPVSTTTDNADASPLPHGAKDIPVLMPPKMDDDNLRINLRLRKGRGKPFGAQSCGCGDCPSPETHATTEGQGDIAEPHEELRDEMTAMPLEMEDLGSELLNTEQVKSIKVAFDTGAGAHVAAPEDLAGFQIEESAASRAGRGFIAANRERIANQGQVRIKVRERDFGNALKTVFQVADVSRPLISGSGVCDEGNEVLMNSREAIVRREDTKKVVAKFKREGGLYVAEMDVITGEPPMPFTRQGVNK